MDFVTDQLGNGGYFLILNVVDDFSREAIEQLVCVSISGVQVACCLSQIVEVRDKIKTIVCDNGTEFIGEAMFFWSKASRVSLGFIQSGNPPRMLFSKA